MVRRRVKGLTAQKFWRLLARFGLGGFLAALILTGLNSFFGAVEVVTVFGVVLIGISTLAVYLWAVNLHPGKEDFVNFVIPYILTTSVVLSVMDLANLKIQVLGIPGEIGIPLALALTAIFVADTVVTNMFKVLVK